MVESKYAARESAFPGGSKGKPRLAAATRKKRTFAAVDTGAFLALGQGYDPSLALFLELTRLSGLRWVKRQDGWATFTPDTLRTLGLEHRTTRRNAVRRGRDDMGWLETRSGGGGHKLEYRLNPSWTQPKAEVINLAAQRKAKGQ